MSALPTNNSLAELYEEMLTEMEEIRRARSMLNLSQLQPVSLCETTGKVGDSHLIGTLDGSMYDRLQNHLWYASEAFFDFVRDSRLEACAYRLVAPTRLVTTPLFLLTNSELETRSRLFRSAVAAILAAISTDDTRVSPLLDMERALVNMQLNLFGRLKCTYQQFRLDFLNKEDAEQMMRSGQMVTESICSAEKFAAIETAIGDGSDAAVAKEVLPSCSETNQQIPSKMETALHPRLKRVRTLTRNRQFTNEK